MGFDNPTVFSNFHRCKHILNIFLLVIIAGRRGQNRQLGLSGPFCWPQHGDLSWEPSLCQIFLTTISTSPQSGIRDDMILWLLTIRCEQLPREQPSSTLSLETTEQTIGRIFLVSSASSVTSALAVLAPSTSKKNVTVTSLYPKASSDFELWHEKRLISIGVEARLL